MEQKGIKRIISNNVYTYKICKNIVKKLFIKLI